MSLVIRFAALTSRQQTRAPVSSRRGISRIISTNSTTRRMASSEAPLQKQEWLVLLPDQEGALDRRMAIRSKHLEGVKADGETGFWLFGGATLSRPQEPTDKVPPMNGSAMLAYAESKEAVLKRLKEDLYTTENVWDWDKVQIWPFRSAIRTGMDTMK